MVLKRIPEYHTHLMAGINDDTVQVKNHGP
jgi:hypothetical protein